MGFDVFFSSKWIRQLLVALVGKLLFFASGIRYGEKEISHVRSRQSRFLNVWIGS